MTPLDVVIVAPEDDLHARAVRAELDRLRARAECVDLTGLATRHVMRLALGDSEQCRITRGDGTEIDLRDARTIWWRRPAAPDGLVADDWRRTTFVADEWAHFCESIEWCTDSRWVNHPSAERAASRRVLQLKQARAAGLRVPATLVTNDRSAVLELAAVDEAIVYKRIGVSRDGPPVPTRLLREEDMSRLDDLAACPAIFQEYIPAASDIRTTFVGGECYSVEIHSEQGKFPTDSRLDLSVPIEPHDLDDGVVERLRALMSELGLVFGAIDLRLTPDGEYVFLEINPSGQFLFAELLTGLPLASRLARFLVAAD
jgi:glutathione synthase/RimK-type ligase-like ATP-grasp enzyme